MDQLRPNESEQIFLTLSYNKFYDIFSEVFADNFWDLDSYLRLAKIKDAFSIYSELLNYEPLKWTIDEVRKKRPPMEAEIGKELFKFVRNVVSHFPFFNSWDEIWINEKVVNWERSGGTIDRFLKQNLNSGTIKYRIWEERKKEFTYVSITFPSKYDDEKIFLKNIMSEKEGVKFSLLLMKRILDTQVEEMGEDV